MTDPRFLNDVQVGDWSVWRLAEDKACPESFGWSVVTDVAEPGGNGGWRSRAIGGFTMTFGEAKKQVTDTIAAYGVRGREVLR